MEIENDGHRDEREFAAEEIDHRFSSSCEQSRRYPQVNPTSTTSNTR